ncbi:hypothetical protein [Herbidospora sp. NBRC 101105]|uniref:hypothetical protein n=1 Tax=Herbidospora sp. NBRC 101105 TaxID=3032195 RepID=UPI0024A4BD6B|nr:hypothetical protein [Herbidospora sp. NBRC 101105]GLX92935.1 hypothetical protein Hesp01_08850 [Herbidospora sp. NBRC 101105]
MPARSNDFQAVVYFVERHLATNATVEESASVMDRVTGKSREVDILITAQVAGRPVRIGVEVRDHGRANDVGFVEEMRAKHDDLPTDQLVLVSASGFSKAAAIKARHYNIETVTPGGPIADDGPLAALHRTAMEAHSIALGDLALIRGTVMVDGQLQHPMLTFQHALFNADGVQVGHIVDLVQMALADFEQQPAPEGTVAGEHFLAVQVPGPEFHMEDGNVVKIHLRTEESPPRLLPLLFLQLAWASRVDVDTVELTTGDLAGTAFAYGSGRMGGADALVVFTATEHGEQLMVRLTDGSGGVTDWIADPEHQRLRPLQTHGNDSTTS